MLVKCPECELQVSDKAISCPHCGMPLNSTNIIARKIRKTNRKKRLPNGFGQITELKGRNLRNPFRAMITVGKNEYGRPICELLKPNAYFRTYNDAYSALVNYHKNPYDVNTKMTMSELYDRWSRQYFEILNSQSSINNIVTAWKYCSAIYGMRVSDVRVRHVKGCIDEGTIIVRGKERNASANTKSRIKSVLNQMLDYAVEYELVDKNYSRNFSIPIDVKKEKNKVKKEHIPFTDSEMEILWSHVNDTPYVDVILIQSYSGWRPQEMGLLELNRVDLDNWSFEGGMKTDAGTDRKVPIHSKIRYLVEQKYNEAKSLNSKYLINAVDSRRKNDLMLTYSKYEKRFAKVRDTLNLNPNHRAHDPRKQFITMCKKYNVNEYAIKYMAGHAISDVTEKVYTEREFSWLESEIEKIK